MKRRELTKGTLFHYKPANPSSYPAYTNLFYQITFCVEDLTVDETTTYLDRRSKETPDGLIWQPIREPCLLLDQEVEVV